MLMMLLMCDEKVLRLCSMLCSSPMSAKTSLKTTAREPWSAGRCSPACAMSVSRPTVLRATVLPPVFGPVMTSMRKRSPSSTVIGTTLPVSSGWRAFLK